jgi:hypothetical protein
VAVEGTWLYHYELETKRQLMEWRQRGSSHSKIFRMQKSDGKFLASISWDQDSILLTDSLPKKQNRIVACYSLLLVQLTDILKEFRQGFLF